MVLHTGSLAGSCCSCCPPATDTCGSFCAHRCRDGHGHTLSLHKVNNCGRNRHRHRHNHRHAGTHRTHEHTGTQNTDTDTNAQAHTEHTYVAHTRVPIWASDSGAQAGGTLKEDANAAAGMLGRCLVEAARLRYLLCVCKCNMQANVSAHATQVHAFTHIHRQTDVQSMYRKIKEMTFANLPAA